MIGGGALLVVDLLFLAANLTKLVHGAWLPLLIGLTAFTVMTTWQRGREIVTRAREQAEGPLRAFVDQLHDHRPPLLRVPGTAVFLNRGKQTAPLAMRANVEHNRVLHQHVVILSIDTLPVPRVPDAERIGGRSSRLRRRRDRPRDRALRVHGNAEHPATRCACSTPPTPRVRSRSRTPPTSCRRSS